MYLGRAKTSLSMHSVPVFAVDGGHLRGWDAGPGVKTAGWATARCFARDGVLRRAMLTVAAFLWRACLEATACILASITHT